MTDSSRHPTRAPVLVSGFEPFGGATGNPSQDVARALDGLRLACGRVVQGMVLPVRFRDAGEALVRRIEETRPCLVLALGLCASRSEPAFERVALNLCDASLADNAGRQPRDEPVIEGGPAALFTTLPVKAMLQALQDAGRPGALSLSAGSYVCNDVFYRLLRASGPLGIPAGFMHLPPVSAMALTEQVHAVRTALDAALAAAGTAGAAPAPQAAGAA